VNRKSAAYEWSYDITQSENRNEETVIHSRVSAIKQESHQRQNDVDSQPDEKPAGLDCGVNRKRRHDVIQTSEWVKRTGKLQESWYSPYIQS
jgi:hypothetical protein